jgi:hypothetical protein
MPEIKVSIRNNQFGTDAVYPVCNTAQLLTQLTGRKTMTARDLETIRQLGYRVTVVGSAAPEWITGRHAS